MRQFLSEKDANDAGQLILEKDDYHYFRQVLRVQLGDKISVRFPDETLEEMFVQEVNDAKKTLTLQLCTDIDDFDFGDADITRGVKAHEISDVLKTEIWLFQFLPKPQKFEQIVRQATECGVSMIVPVIGEYSDKGAVLAYSSGNKFERLLKIVKEARQQSGSPIDTKVLLPVSLQDAVKAWNNHTVDDGGAAFALCERSEMTGSISKNLDKEHLSMAALAVGCEGGISPAEIEYLKEKGRFVPIHFDINILRSETAAVYGIAALQTCLEKRISE